jgi:hypothetical protein
MTSSLKDKVDTVALLASVDIAEVIGRFIELRKDGSEYTACCPFHSESTPSFKVSKVKQYYHCFGCGAHGDAIDFIREYERVDFKKAVEILNGGQPITVRASTSTAKKKAPPSPWVPIQPVDDDVFAAPKTHGYRGTPDEIYTYKDVGGALLGYVYRFRTSDGGKETLPLVWARNTETGERMWRWMAFPEPRPLYGLDKLAENPKGREGTPVLVVEGEKCANAGQAELAYPVVSWPGGSKAAGKADFSPLAGSIAILWADCDAKRERLTPTEKAAGMDPGSKPLLPEAEQPGVQAMTHIAEQLAALVPPAKVFWVKIPKPGEKPDGWDIADAIAEGLKGPALAEFIKKRSKRWQPASGSAPILAAETPPPPVSGLAPAVADIQVETQRRIAFEKRIEAGESFEDLAYKLAGEIQSAGLRQSTVDALLKRIKAKTGASIKSLKADAPAMPPQGRGPKPGEPDYLAELNSLHAIVYLAGKVRILTEKIGGISKRPEITFCSRQDLVLLYENREVFVNGESVDWGSAWLKHPERREYEGVAFEPGREREFDGMYNLWQGWGVESRPGGSYRLFLDFVRDVICAGDEEAYQYVLSWMAHLVQFPHDLPGASLVMRSGQRTGKGTFVEVLSKLVGHAHYVELTNTKHLTGQFQGHLANAILVFANEATWGGNKTDEGALKGMITDPTTLLEKKGVDAVSVRNFKRLIVGTNNDFPVPRDKDDARFVVLDVSECHKEDWEYFRAIRAEMANGGYEALMYYLIHDVVIDGWHPRQIPTPLRQKGWDIKIQGANSFTKWWYECLWQGWIYQKSGGYAAETQYLWPAKLTTTFTRDVYQHWGRRQNLPYHQYVDIREIGKLLAEWGIEKKRDSEAPRPWEYHFPPLAEARQAFGKKIGIPHEDWLEA